MPEVEDRKVPYEILIRYGEDGEIQGAHLAERRIVTVDGERLKDEVLLPVALDLAEGGQRQWLQAVLGDQLTTALTTVEEVKRERDAARDELRKRPVQRAPADGQA